MKVFFLLISAFLTFLPAATYGQRDDGSVRAVADANEKFTSSLYEVLTKGKSENLIFSPFSLSTVLAMVKAGAGGKTAEEIKQVLHFPNDDTLFKGYRSLISTLKSNENFTLETANRIYSKDGFKLKSRFLEIISNYFNSEVEQLDFTQSEASATQINSWVESITRNKIKDLISAGDLDFMTRLVLVNAIYFKGFWKNKFDPQLTRKGDFFVSEDKNVSVDMMRIESEFPYVDLTKDLDARAISIPYQGDRLSFVIILPNAKNGLKSLESKLRNWDLSSITSQMNSRKVMLQMPKFKLESKIDLKEPLSELGLRSMFDQNEADLSGIPEVKEDLYVSKAVQKAFIEINEEGSEAAAATGIQIVLKSAFFGPTMAIRSPFLAYIRDDYTGQILFQAAVHDPTVESFDFRSNLIDPRHESRSNGAPTSVHLGFISLSLMMTLSYIFA